MRLALVEIDTVWEDPAANRNRIRNAVPDADLAVLPEMAFTGFTMAGRADPDAEPFLTALARERGMALVAGYVGAGPSNCAAAVGPAGDVIARYTKIHPFSYAGEDNHYVAGRELPVFELCGARVAMLICYDLRFPEVFREAVRAGAEMFIVPANWPAARVDHWRTLLRARAIENQAFVIGVNRVGSDPNVAYESSSLAIGPRGEVLHEGAGVVELDLADVAAWREEFPALRDMRSGSRKPETGNSAAG